MRQKSKKCFVVHNFDLFLTWRIEEKKAQREFCIGKCCGYLYVYVCVQWQYLILMQIYYNKDPM